MKINKSKILPVLFYYLTFSGLVIALLYSVSDSVDWIYLKDGAVLLVALVAVLVNIRSLPRNVLACVVPIVMLVSVSFVLSPAPFFSKVASARQILMPFIFILVGYSLSTGSNYGRLVKAFFACIAFIVVFGVFERVFGVWSIISIENFFRSKNLPVFYNGYPVIFVEPLSVFGFRDFEHGVYRMASLILDPINLGHILTAAVIMMLFDKDGYVDGDKKKLLMVGACCCLILTFSKGAFLQFFLSFAILKKKNRYAYIALSSIIAIPLLILYIQSHSGFLIHLRGFFSVFEYLTLLGHGLATFGNYSILYNAGSISSGVGVADSFWSSVLGQLGIVGFFAWISPILYFCWVARRNKPLSALVLTQVLISSLSENSFNFMSIAFTLILMGSYLRHEYCQKLRAAQEANNFRHQGRPC